MHASFITTFLLATVASVSALSLADLDPIPDNTVTPGCLTAYEKEISACPDAADFRAKKTCSSECEAALSTFSQDTILVCRQAFVSPDSLLRRLLDGGLVTTLCPASSSSSSSSSSTSAYATSTTAPASSSTPAASLTKIKTESATSTTTPLPSVISFSGFMTITTSSAAETTSVPAELILDESAEPTVSSEVSALAVEISSTASASKSVETSSSTASGNGSPFESSAGTTTTSSENAAGSVKAVWTTAMIGASVALGAILL